MPPGFCVNRNTFNDLAGFGQPVDGRILHAKGAQALANRRDARFVADPERVQIIFLRGDQVRTVDPVEETAGADGVALGIDRQVLNPAF